MKIEWKKETNRKERKQKKGERKNRERTKCREKKKRVGNLEEKCGESDLINTEQERKGKG